MPAEMGGETVLDDLDARSLVESSPSIVSEYADSSESSPASSDGGRRPSCASESFCLGRGCSSGCAGSDGG